jgi:hypothetical protein
LDAGMLRKGHGSHWDRFNESKYLSHVNFFEKFESFEFE